jgi:asparagine synthase (glutamine-hydrolysing)
MCGIAGYFGTKALDTDKIQKTLQLMKNRGPDNQTFKKFQTSSEQIYLMHSRLSIIDLNDRSDQPFYDNGCTLVFNGEIYNFVEIRKYLEYQGHQFKTQSDTEVLLKSYLVYGESCVHLFEGMWAFAIYDSRNQTVFLSRDRFGEKPLYYLQNEEGFYFGSEIKFLKSMVSHPLRKNENQLIRYMINGYKSLYKKNETFYLDVFEVPQGSNLILSSGKRNFNKYWNPSYHPRIMNSEEAIEGIRHHLTESMRLRLRSDVPLAFCLSGGIDSSTLASFAAKKFNYDVVSYSIIDSDERYNEAENIRATVNDIGCKANFIELKPDKTLNDLSDLINYHDGPIATITYFIHSHLSKAISQDGYRVVISGTSADELFTGYYDHFLLHLYEMRNHPSLNKSIADWTNGIGKFIRNPILQSANLYIDNPNFREHVYDNSNEFKGLLKKNFNEEFCEFSFTTSSLLRNRMLNELMFEATPVILHEDDLNSMKYSIENRSPYLDSKLFNFAFSIPSELLIQKGFGKYLLREAANGILNDKVRLDIQKKGFNASINSIVDFKDKNTRDFLLSDSPVFDIVDRTKFSKYLDMEHIPNSHSKFIFSLINAKIFMELN